MAFDEDTVSVGQQDQGDPEQRKIVRVRFGALVQHNVSDEWY